MRVDEMYASCELAIARVETLNLIATAKIQLVVPGNEPKGRTIGLFGRYGPRGEIMNWISGNGTVALFDAAKVMSFIEKNDLLAIEIERDKEGLDPGEHD